MLRRTQKPEGMLYEVLRDDTGQIVWSKLVPWGRWSRRQDEFEEAARKQERIAGSTSKENIKGNSKKRPQ
jgi:hypothetical protein